MLGEYVRHVGVIKQGQTSQLGQRLKESELGKGGGEGFGLVVQGVFIMLSCILIRSMGSCLNLLHPFSTYKLQSKRYAVNE